MQGMPRLRLVTRLPSRVRGFAGEAGEKPVALRKRSAASQRAPMGWVALGAFGVSATAAAMWYTNEKQKRQEAASKKQVTYGVPDLGGPWTLVDAASAAPVTDASYLGSYTMMYFGFTRCPDICPAELLKIGDVLALLDAADCDEFEADPIALRPLFVSLDPRRDTIQQLRAYAADFDPRLRFLCGAPEQIKVASKAYRVYSSVAAPPEGDDDYLLDHSIVLYLNGPDGKFLDFFTQSTTPRDIAEKIKAHHRQWQTKDD